MHLQTILHQTSLRILIYKRGMQYGENIMSHEFDIPVVWIIIKQFIDQFVPSMNNLYNENLHVSVT